MENNENKIVDITKDIIEHGKDLKFTSKDSDIYNFMGSLAKSKKLDYSFSVMAKQDLKTGEITHESEEEILENIVSLLRQFQKENPNFYIHGVMLTPIFLNNNDVRRMVVFKYVEVEIIYAYNTV